MLMSYAIIYPLPYPPAEACLTRLEQLIREGLAPALTGAAWTGRDAPEGHWLMPKGTRLHRGNVPADVEPPEVALFFARDAEPVAQNDSRYWYLYPIINLAWCVDLVTADTDQLRFVLSSLFTQDMTAPVPEAQRRAIDRLSMPATSTAPGIRVFEISRLAVEMEKREEGHPELVMTFRLMCAGLAPEPA